LAFVFDLLSDATFDNKIHLFIVSIPNFDIIDEDLKEEYSIKNIQYYKEDVSVYIYLFIIIIALYYLLDSNLGVLLLDSPNNSDISVIRESNVIIESCDYPNNPSNNNNDNSDGDTYRIPLVLTNSDKIRR
jgi:hypothetical protein